MTQQSIRTDHTVAQV